MKFAAFAFALLATSPAVAAPLLHPMFNDHAVLQRDKPIPVYGNAAPGADVSVLIDGASVTAKAGKDGHWRANLPAMHAGGPYTLQVSSGGQIQSISDVLVGDVFLCAGQSNMQLNVRRAGNAEFEIANATDSLVRELAVDRVPSPVRLDSFTSPVSWKVESPQTAGDMSASCFFFARELRKHVKVPIGLITAAWGGTRERGWISHPTLRRFGYYNDDLDMLALYTRDPAAASKRWDAAWENWWHSESKDSPWKEDTSSWTVAPKELGPWGDWPGLTAPEGTTEAGVGIFVGQMWLTTHVTLTAAQAAQPATLALGKAVEEEKSWVNGVGVGGSSIEPDARHAIPAGLLHAGDNTVTVNIFCSWRNCGLSGPADTRAIVLGDGSKVLLDQPWRYKAVDTRIAPQIPWGPMHGIGLQYNGMIAPIGPYGVKAAIWYQGESNLYFAKHYQEGLTALMSDWRAQFGAMPFLVVQIPNYGPAPTQPAESLWSDVREAQRKTVEADANAALVVAFDIGDAKNLHPPNKQEIGRRLSIAARHQIYGESIAPSGPRMVSAKRSGNAVTVSFKDVTGALAAHNGAPNAFELCDDKSCRWTQAILSGNTVTLHGSGGKVRYCWGDSPICTLTDATGLPAGPFEVPIQ
ncbi:MAG: sialate O-acetylesterase [Alphaproteobacteria bacterium]